LDGHAAVRPGASALFESTMAISVWGRRPSAMAWWMARKLEPRPESRMPRRFTYQG
jgi:hypothetical protein